MATEDFSGIPLGEVAYRRLRSQIVDCRLLPGQLVTERMLAAQLEIGISPVREGLTRLDHEGLVRTLPRKGYEVTPLTTKSIDDVYEYWTTIGPALVRLGVQRASDEQLTVIRSRFTDVHKVFDNGTGHPDLNHQATALVDDAFAILAAATRNHHFLTEFHRLSGELARVRSLVLDTDHSASEHFTSEVLNWNEVLGRRDADGAAAITRRYIEASHHRCLRALARNPTVLAAGSATSRPSGAS